MRYFIWPSNKPQSSWKPRNLFPGRQLLCLIG